METYSEQPILYQIHFLEWENKNRNLSDLSNPDDTNKRHIRPQVGKLMIAINIIGANDNERLEGKSLL